MLTENANIYRRPWHGFKAFYRAKEAVDFEEFG